MTPGPDGQRSLSRPVIGFVLGALLLGAAAWVVIRQGKDLQSAIESARHAPWWLVAAALVLPLLNWLLMSVSFWVLMRRHGPVGLGEMTSLIGAAWLLNYLPLRPGLIGRVGYHKTVHGIPVAKSVTATVAAIGCSGVAIVAMVGALVGSTMAGSGALSVGAAAAAPLALALIAGGALRRTHRFGWVPLIVAFRYLDLLVWAARYAVAFAIIGRPISAAAAAAIACVCQIAMLVPFFGNGLGLREWAVGVTASSLPRDVLTASGALATTVGLAADLVNRAAEICGAIPVGLICAARLSARAR